MKTDDKKWQNLFEQQNSQKKSTENKVNQQRVSSYLFIYDCEENVILFTNSAYNAITGFPDTDHTLEFFLENIHPNDLDHFYSCEQKTLDFTNELSYDAHFHFIFSYLLRIKTKSGKYIKILQQCQAIEVNESGHIAKTLVTHQVLKDQETDNLDFRVFDKTKNSYLNLENDYRLTKRELEILECIKFGNNSTAISEKLNISKNTVLTHRKNILNKTKSKSFIELLKKLSSTAY